MSYRVKTPFGEFVVHDLELARKMQREFRTLVGPGDAIPLAPERPTPERPPAGGASGLAPGRAAVRSPAGPDEPQPTRLPGRLGERRRWPRKRLAGVFISVEAPGRLAEPWVSKAVDISSEGVGLDLPPSLEPRTNVLLSFTLDAQARFFHVPSVVLRQGAVTGAAGFRWRTPGDRARLLRHLS